VGVERRNSNERNHTSSSDLGGRGRHPAPLPEAPSLQARPVGVSLEFLLSKQNRDGGWPYVRGSSWTEPTAYAVLALLSAGEEAPAERGLVWLRSLERRDGGWAPNPAVEESTWVTALVALLPPERFGQERHARTINWLLGTSGRETAGLMQRLRLWLLGAPSNPDLRYPGWPWMPGAAAWVGPTALAILALEKESRLHNTPPIRRRIEDGRRFLMLHMCHEGGWNHGAARALGWEASPYPETTGLALAALRGVQGGQIERSVALARRFLAECHSADALNWLRLGLLAHGELPRDVAAPHGLEYRTVAENSLRMLVSGVETGRNCFWT